VATKRTRRVRAIALTGVVAALATAGLASTSGAAVPAADPGVTNKTVTIGYIYPATGVAASISQNGIKAFNARIDRQNAAGGVNGRKIKVVAKDDGSSAQNVTVTHDLAARVRSYELLAEAFGLTPRLKSAAE